MKVITTNPILVAGRTRAKSDIFSGLDGSSSADEILKFQYWMEHNHDNVKYGKLRVFDADTSNAWKLYGKEYKKDQNKPVIPTSFLGRPASTGTASQSQKDEWAKAALNVFSNSKTSPTVSDPSMDLPGQKPPMKKGVKIALITGGILIVGIGIYLLTRPKSSK